MDERGEPVDGKPATGPESSGLLTEIGQLGSAFKRLFGVQMHLLAAELGLARSAVSWMLVAALVSIVLAVGLGLTLLGLAGVALASWFGSWIWALLALAALQILLLFGAIVLFRRCMHWISLPATRSEWNAMMRDTLRKTEDRADAAPAPHGGEQP